MRFVMEILYKEVSKLRKLMLLMAMLAMVLVAAAPAMAQDATATDGDATGGDVTTTETQYQNQLLSCAVFTGPISQYQNGDAIASGDDAVAAIANEQGVSVDIVQTCTQAGEDAFVNVNTGEVFTADEAVALEESGEAVVEDTAVANAVDDDADGTVDEADGTEEAAVEGSESSDEAAMLPDTGGASLFTLGAGALLVGGGLLARRIFS